ncbi:anti-sigma factor [Rhizobium sp. BK376]|jgi:anti-sigma factor RsiW|uniref:anti-sigma factor family protein n=1 Tax=Rhizobium sp. BK376 TaxID=2512149 RepID=UPI00104CDBEA|nr:anti-sigma factor [Rhizobium sp. BK376]TCR92135.1 anti-sigma factor RsiW [Rhizobium sp. BK376]
MPIEARLSAYMDGETTREEKEELEHLIASDPEARQIYETLRHGSDVGRKAFDEVLKEPVPLSLVRAIKSVQPPKMRETPRLARPPLKLAPNGRQALAASLILFVIGGGIGYFVGSQPAAPPAPTPIAQIPSHTWLDEIAASHRIYSHQPQHISEVPAIQADEISRWLTQSVGVKFAVPDLASDGLTFQGARLLVAAGKPVGQLSYTNGDGDIIAIYFLKDNDTTASDEFNEVIKDDVGVVSWHRSGVAYAVAGPSSDPTLDDIADRVSNQI